VSDKIKPPNCSQDLDHNSLRNLLNSLPLLYLQGLWLELELVYTGCLQMTLETKMNLCKLGKEGEDEAHNIPETQQVG